MTRRMLINAQSKGQLRVAVVSDSKLDSYQVEVAESGLTRGNIYRGVIAAVQPSLNAAFVDYGAPKHGFLPIQDVVPEARYKQPTGAGRPRIDEVLERGKAIVVQVSRDPEGGKGAALTTNLSLAGRYLVLTPFDPMRGVSRKVEDEETRRELKELAKVLEMPEGCGIIVRTNARDQNRTALHRDLTALLRLWKRVRAEARHGGGTKLLYSDQELIFKALRDTLDGTVTEVLVDDEVAFQKVREYVQAFMPRTRMRLQHYSDRLPLFSRYELETQIEAIYRRTVPLASGGSIVIDATEALTAIDVNSGRSKRGGTHEETALQTNLEAADEVARQLRLRDIGGLLVVDFIDMGSPKHRRKVEKAMRDAMKADKARVAVGRISSNGLLEINRQRIQQALLVRTHRACPTCDGTGRIASPEFVGLSLLRRIESRAVTGRLERVRIELHPELADAFQNERRQDIAALEREFDLSIEVIASPGLHRHEEEIEWEERSADAQQAAASRGAVQASDLARLAADGRQTAPTRRDQQETPPGAAADEGARPSRRRRRRRRKRPGEEDQGALGVPAPVASAPEPPPPMPAALDEKAVAPSAKPQKRRRHRRTGRRNGDPKGTPRTPPEPT